MAGHSKNVFLAPITACSSALQSLVSSPQTGTRPALPTPKQIMFFTSLLGGDDSTIPANAGSAHTGGPQQVLCAPAALSLRQARHVSEALANGEPACQAATSPLSNAHGQDGGVDSGQEKNALFSLMTFMLVVSHRVVRRPAQIMLTVFAGSTITLGVNWWATHSGGPMHGEILPLSVMQAWQSADAVPAIVSCSKSCDRSVVRVGTGLPSSEHLTSCTSAAVSEGLQHTHIQSRIGEAARPCWHFTVVEAAREAADVRACSGNAASQVHVVARRRHALREGQDLGRAINIGSSSRALRGEVVRGLVRAEACLWLAHVGARNPVAVRVLGGKHLRKVRSTHLVRDSSESTATPCAQAMVAVLTGGYARSIPATVPL